MSDDPLQYNPFQFFTKARDIQSRIVCEFDHKKLWQVGHLRDLPDIVFEAKIYDAPSKYGIKNGHISKLLVYEREATADGEAECIIEYQRGWGTKPKGRTAKKILNDIVRYFDHELEWPGKVTNRPN